MAHQIRVSLSPSSSFSAPTRRGSQECRVLAPKAMAMDSLELPNGCKNLWNRQVTPAFAGAVAVAQQ
uniref:Uncharacterized protein n=1 Tax=Oryza barthii TaxID=65489 RepID=A0A0D3G468_9ORYZ